jgi:hypothetical protein
LRIPIDLEPVSKTKWAGWIWRFGVGLQVPSRRGNGWRGWRAAPATGFTEVPLTGTTTYKFLRYLSPTNGFGSVAEIEFYTKL